MLKAWHEEVTLPTYRVGEAEKNPIFLEKRVYQGSSGAVYPYPVIESVENKPVDEKYNACFLENDYVKIMILPELGGRVQMAYDKIRQRHFVYYNHVIKPALVGLAGPWISGGIEFNWPQHHRPSTYMPVDSKIVENADGSVTVWVNERERMTHQKGMAGFTLYPDKAYLEIKGVVYNPSELPQSFLWWANPAVSVGEYYQSIFPPDINAVFDHGKRAVSTFPIATGTYYKMDYSAGVDISNYKNIKVPTSYMGTGSRYDFEGGYENDTRAGMLHVADHHFSPGKKQWTWGNGEFGRAWDRNLTDVDGPYIELMAGIYTENQPDFTWLMPYEEKHFTQYFMPFAEVGIVKQASKDLIFNINEVERHKVEILLYGTSKQTVTVVVRTKQREIAKFSCELSPANIIRQNVDLAEYDLKDIEVAIYGEADAMNPFGLPVLTWTPEPDEIRQTPPSAEAALPPADVRTVEQLFMTGMHLEQYRHATWSAKDYYEEGLKREPDNIQCLNALGKWYVRRGRPEKAEPLLRKAVKVSMRRNPNPYDGEAIFNLGLALKFQGKRNEAYDLFWKSTWNKAWADAGFFEAAQISFAQHRLANALDEVNRALEINGHNHRARALKSMILVAVSQKEAADANSRESLGIDPFNYACLDKLGDIKLRDELMNRNIENYHFLACDYISCGQWKDSARVLREAVEMGIATTMTYYYLAFVSFMDGDREKAAEYSKTASESDLSWCFPNRLIDIAVLGIAKEINPKDGVPNHLLGCLYYDKRQYDLAISNWEMAVTLMPTFPTAKRCLALARFNKQDRYDDALKLMEEAYALDKNDARILMELDSLSRRLQQPADLRLTRLTENSAVVARRDDLIIERLTLMAMNGHATEAKDLLEAHIFHPWEGGEGKAPGVYKLILTELAKTAIATNNYKEAIDLLKQSLVYPEYLGEGKLSETQDSDVHYLLGLLYGLQGNTAEANKEYELATYGPQEPVAAMYYNDARPDQIFYQAKAYLKLGNFDEARKRFFRLINYGQQHIAEHQTMDYFAVSLPDLLIWEDSLDDKNKIHCLYMLALGYIGLSCCRRIEDAQAVPVVSHNVKLPESSVTYAKAMGYLNELAKMDIYHTGVFSLRSFLKLNL